MIFIKKLKILHILATNKFSGAESVVCDIIQNSSDLYQHVYCSLDGPISDILEKKNINFYPVKKLNISNIKKVLKEVKPNVIHAHDFRVSFVTALCKKNIKMIAHIHNNSPWIKRINVKSLIFLYSIIKSYKVLVVSEAINNEYVFKKVLQKKSICVGNPVFRNKVLNMVKDNVQEKIDAYDICCVARITEAKDPLRFLKIVFELKKIIPMLKVSWVGDGELKDKVLKYAKELDLCDTIDFLGFKNNPYIYMNKSKVFLLTSKWEGFGLVAFEALTLGKPCVVSNVGGLKSIVDDSCGKLCNNDEEFVEEIRNLLLDEKYYEKKSKNASDKSIKLENCDTYIDLLEDIYKE